MNSKRLAIAMSDSQGNLFLTFCPHNRCVMWRFNANPPPRLKWKYNRCRF